jgi:enamine deaminase RidA (YjgF/YER057c/UK114 family)
MAERRLRNLGISLPNSPHPLGAYVEAVQSGNLLFLSGMLPVKEGKLQHVGRLGKELDETAGRDALRTATLNALAATLVTRSSKTGALFVRMCECFSTN